MNKNKLLNTTVYLTFIILVCFGVIGGCGNDIDNDLNGEDDMGTLSTTLNISNEGVATTVYAVFGSESCTIISDWSTISCTSGNTTCTTTINDSICSFPIASGDMCTPPLRADCQTSINFAFDEEVLTMPCGMTAGTGPSLAEININGNDCSKTPGCDSPPCDCADISLVQGYKLPNISMTLSKGPTTLGPTLGATGNQDVFGVFPVGCTNCLNREGCPCGIDCKDTTQCHQGGTPNDPDVPCQASQPTGGTITIHILEN